MKNIEQLIKDHKNLIEQQVQQHSAFIPSSAVRMEAYKLARDAAEKYDEKSGYKFSTYLTNALQKLSRLSTQYGSAIRVSENKQFKLNKLNKVESNLESELGRTPTVSELADATGMSLPQLNNLMQDRKKSVNMNNLAFSPVFEDSEDDDWIHFVYHDLPARDKLIFEHKTGFGNKPILSNSEIAKKVGISPTMVGTRIKQISEKIGKKW